MSFEMLPDREDGLETSGYNEPEPEKEIDLSWIFILLVNVGAVVVVLPILGVVIHLLAKLFMLGWNWL